MTKNYLKLIGIQIRKLRKERKLTQEDLADRASLNPNYLGRIERGEINVTVDTLLKIAEALKVDISLFFALPESRTTQKSEKDLKKELKKLIERKRPRELQTLASLLELANEIKVKA